MCVVTDAEALRVHDSQIPGSQSAPDYGDGFYTYPCDTQVMVSFVLGTTTLALDPRDMNIGRYTSDPSGRSATVAPSFPFLYSNKNKKDVRWRGHRSRVHR